jgi:pilus assembly protein CpaB
MKSKYILIIAIMLAAVTTLMFGKYLKDLDKKYTSGKSLVQVVVLKQDIKKNQKISSDLLELKSYHSGSVLPDAVKKVQDIEGSYALIDMRAGEVLYPSRFLNQVKEKELIARKIKEGYRAISIEANFVESLSTMIEPEDYVDVLFSEKIATGINTIALLENVRVLAVGKRIVESSAGSTVGEVKEAAEADSKSDQSTYNSVTLELNPAQIRAIVNADERGNIKFVLRSKLEQK